MLTYLNVSLRSDSTGDGLLGLWDMDGKRLKQAPINLATQNIEWDMSDYSQGVYLLSLQDANGVLLKTIKIAKASN